MISDLARSLFVFVFFSSLSLLFLFPSHLVPVFFSCKTVGPSGTNDLSCVELVDFHITPSPRKSDRLTMTLTYLTQACFSTQCKLGVTSDGLPRGLFLGSTETRVLFVDLVQWVFQFLLVFLERERRQLR